MSAFDVAVSALSNQRERLELLGTNIANINTPGYKTSRMTFVETLGAIVNVTRSPFTQGSLEFTGNSTDLAINGNGFFIIQKGDQLVYTRAGAFFIDADGKLINADGYVVQGWMNNLNESGSTRSSSQLSDVILDPNMIMPAKTTQNVFLSGNLDASLTPKAQEFSTSGAFTTKAILTSSVTDFSPLSIEAGVNDQFIIQHEPSSGGLTTEEITLTAGVYNDLDSLVTEINNQIAASGILEGTVEAINVNGVLKFRATDEENGTDLTLKAGANDILSELGFADNVVATSGTAATAETEINDLLQVTGDFVAGDTLNVTGSARDGASVAGTYTYGADNDGTTLGDLVAVMNTTFAGNSTVTIEEGNIVMTDDVAGDSESIIDLAAGNNSVSGKIKLPDFTNTVPGFTGRVTTSMVVFDSLGASHNLITEFTKTINDGEWTWKITGSGTETMVSGYTGKILFDSQGSFISFQYDDGVNGLTFAPGEGAATMTIKINGKGGDGFSGLSGFDHQANVVHAKGQDGRETGSLSGFHIDKDGAIYGSFTNGENQKLGQIALAKFNNPSGLDKVSGSNFIDTIDSGIPQVGTADSLDSDIESGSLESSTVDLTEELTQMIQAQRSFQAAARVLSTYTDFLEETVRLG